MNEPNRVHSLFVYLVLLCSGLSLHSRPNFLSLFLFLLCSGLFPPSRPHSMFLFLICCSYSCSCSGPFWIVSAHHVPLPAQRTPFVGRLPYIRHKDFLLRPAPSRAGYPPTPLLKSVTGWTGELWLNHVLLMLEN